MTDIGYAYGYQTAAIAARDEEGDRMYPCPVCGGIGYTGRDLTVPCRTCGTAGEVYDEPRREQPPAPVQDSEWTRPLPGDPWMDPARAAELGPPPF